MKRGFRLNKPADVKRVRRQGRAYAHPFLMLIVLPNEIGRIRVAVTAGSLVGGAVQRNRAKRVLRAGINPLLERIVPGHDIVFIAKPGFTSAKAPQAATIISELLHKANVMK